MELIICILIWLVLVPFLWCYCWAPNSPLDLDYSIKEHRRGVNSLIVLEKWVYKNTNFASAWGLRVTLLLASFVPRMSLIPPAGTYLTLHGVPTSKSDPLETVLPEQVFCHELSFTHMSHTSGEYPSWRSHIHVAGRLWRDLLGQM